MPVRPYQEKSPTFSLTTKHCPYCGSPDIEIDREKRDYSIKDYRSLIYWCKNCLSIFTAQKLGNY